MKACIFVLEDRIYLAILKINKPHDMDIVSGYSPYGADKIVIRCTA